MRNGNLVMLRFDVETISKATGDWHLLNSLKLRFDVETISKATYTKSHHAVHGCGLM